MDSKVPKYISDVKLDYRTPVVGCKIIPRVSVNGEGPGNDSLILSFKWYKEQQRTCSMHHTKLANLQCVSCVKLNIPIKESYHCSRECFVKSWQTHLQRHGEAKNIRQTLTDDKQAVRKLRSCGSWPELNSGSLIDKTAAMVEEGKEWHIVSDSSNYVPKIDDIGLCLKLECEAVDHSTNTALSPKYVVVSDPVVEFPSARLMIKIDGPIEPSNGITFSILSYNILSDMYILGKYQYCPNLALMWEYRRQKLLSEIIGYRADIICLQEVQNNHFENFFEPELKKHGYLARYKKKTRNEVFVGDQFVIDGCATFYRKDRFRVTVKHEIEFEQKASALLEAHKPELKREAKYHFMKDNVALLIILEALENDSTYDTFQSRICVVNTHICSNQQLSDVKLLQVVTLINELEEKLNPKLPVLICGDFNSSPQSDPHTFIVSGKLEHSEEKHVDDPYGVYQHLKLHHSIALESAYTAFLRANEVDERHRSKFNQETREPKATIFTKGFSGTLDYIFFTANRLKVEELLELLDDEEVDVGLPSPLWSSDHIAIMAKFRIRAENPGS